MFLSLLIAILILGILAYLVLRPDPAIIETERDGAQVYFASDHRLVLSPFECVDARWRVGNIRTVFLNDKGQIGEGQTTLCLTPLTMPTLLLTLQDDSQQIYSLDVRSIFLYPPTLILIVIAGGALWYAGQHISSPKIIRLSKRVLRLENLVTVMGVLLLAQMAQLRFDLDDYNIIRNGEPLTIDADEVENRSLEAEAADRDGQVERLLAVRDHTPENAVILIPFDTEHAMVAHAVTYPRKFYWVGDVERYLRRYVGDGSLSFVRTAQEHLRMMRQLDTLQPLYLLLNEDYYEKFQAQDFGAIVEAEMVVDDDPLYVLLTVKADVSAEEVDAAVKTMQAQ